MPKAMRALQPTSNYVNSSGLDHRLLELVKMRTSQLNGCAYCIDMHTKDARAADGHVPDEVYAAARDHFSEEELVDLTIAVIATNGWNRLNIAFRPEVGGYRPGMFDQPKTAPAAI